jgi:hypothetical protein
VIIGESRQVFQELLLFIQSKNDLTLAGITIYFIVHLMSTRMKMEVRVFAVTIQLEEFLTARLLLTTIEAYSFLQKN